MRVRKISAPPSERFHTLGEPHNTDAVTGLLPDQVGPGGIQRQRSFPSRSKHTSTLSSKFENSAYTRPALSMAGVDPHWTLVPTGRTHSSAPFSERYFHSCSMRSVR
jgi:hypothetical protein